MKYDPIFSVYPNSQMGRMSDLRRRGTYRRNENTFRMTLNQKREARKNLLNRAPPLAKTRGKMYSNILFTFDILDLWSNSLKSIQGKHGRKRLFKLKL